MEQIRLPNNSQTPKAEEAKEAEEGDREKNLATAYSVRSEL